MVAVIRHSFELDVQLALIDCVLVWPCWVLCKVDIIEEAVLDVYRYIDLAAWIKTPEVTI